MAAPATVESLTEQITVQNALVNKLREDRAEAVTLDEARKRLGELKKTLGQMKASASGERDSGKKKERLLLKTAKVRLYIYLCFSHLDIV